MCLDTVDEKTKDFTYGWKIFEKENRSLIGRYMTKPSFYNKGYPIEKWIQDYKTGTIVSFYGSLYKRGFHFYKTREAAREEIRYLDDFSIWNNRHFLVKKIKVRNIVASGTQDGKIVGVAKEMFILK